MTEPSKSLTQRVKDKIGDKLGEKVAEWVIGAVLLAGTALLGGLGVLARHWVTNELACIKKPWCEVRGWTLGALIAATLVTTGAAVYFGVKLYRTRRELRGLRAVPATKVERVRAYMPPPSAPPFRRIPVEDKQLRLRWLIRKSPDEWLQWRDVAHTVSPVFVRDVLDGPFHAAPDCNAPLEEIPDGSSGGYGQSSPTFSEWCPSCGQQVFRVHRSESVYVWPVRAQALEELQRMERNGSAFDGTPIVLERPAYWKKMLLPR